MLPDKGNLSLSLHNYLLPLNNIHLVCLCGNDNLLIWTQFSLVFRTVSYELCASLNKAPDISASRKATDSLAVHVNSHHALMCVMHELKVSSQKVQLDIRKKKKKQWCSGTAVHRGGEVPIPGGIHEPWGCGTWKHGFVGTVGKVWGWTWKS